MVRGPCPTPLPPPQAHGWLADGNWALALITELGTCHITPHDELSRAQTAATIHCGAQLLVRHATLCGASCAALCVQVRTLCGLVAWLERCEGACARVGATLLSAGEMQTLCARLRGLAGTWSGTALPQLAGLLLVDNADFAAAMAALDLLCRKGPYNSVASDQ